MTLTQIIGSISATLAFGGFIALLIIASFPIWERIKQHEAKFVGIIWLFSIMSLVCIIIFSYTKQS